MSGTLRQARILSSETDNTIKQEQNTNVNINIKPHHERRPSTVPSPLPEPLRNDVNFIPVVPQERDLPGGIPSDTQMTTPELAYPSPQPIDSLCRDRGIADMGSELDNLDKKNRFLEMLVEMYENNPLKVNSYVVCESRLLMEMIKLLTGCEKVDLVLNDDVSCGGCGGKSSKIIHVSKILITIDGKSEDLKYCRNDVYSEFVRYGVSLKMVC